MLCFAWVTWLWWGNEGRLWKGLKVPDDISIIGISNGIIPTLFQPQITHVVTSGYKLGKLAFQQMSKRLKNEPISEDVSVESFLVEGDPL